MAFAGMEEPCGIDPNTTQGTTEGAHMRSNSKLLTNKHSRWAVSLATDYSFKESLTRKSPRRGHQLIKRKRSHYNADTQVRFIQKRSWTLWKIEQPERWFGGIICLSPTGSGARHACPFDYWHVEREFGTGALLGKCTEVPILQTDQKPESYLVEG